MSEILIIGQIECAEGDRELWMSHATSLAEASRDEAGVLRHEVIADPASSTRIVVIEHYASPEALARHRASKHLNVFRAATASCVVQNVVVDAFEVTATSLSRLADEDDDESSSQVGGRSSSQRR